MCCVLCEPIFDDEGNLNSCFKGLECRGRSLDNCTRCLSGNGSSEHTGIFLDNYLIFNFAHIRFVIRLLLDHQQRLIQHVQKT